MIAGLWLCVIMCGFRIVVLLLGVIGDEDLNPTGRLMLVAGVVSWAVGLWSAYSAIGVVEVMP